MKPIATIGICVKDCEATIKKAIESVLDQDFPHESMELILVNDGSRDKTLPILQHYVSKMDIPVKLFNNEWKGIGAARNIVVDNASGDYIVWVDGDMVLPRDHVRKQVEFMERNPKVGIAKARYGMLHKESLVAFLENIVDIAEDVVAEDEWKTDLKLPGTGGSIYRVEAIKQVGGFDENLKRVGEDQDAAYRVKKAGWLICRTNAVFYEGRKLNTWKPLWNKFFWHGYDHYRLYRKNRSLFIFYKMVPLASFIAGVLYSIIAYRFTRRKVVFLLPFQYTFKMTAWFLGFLKGQIAFS